MKTIHISQYGNDRNYGVTRETAVRSWERAVQLADSNSEFVMTAATLTRVSDEIQKAKRQQAYSKSAWG